jgi:hypothetical protein
LLLRKVAGKTERQGSDQAILRTPKVLLDLFSIVTLWTHEFALNGH